MFSEALVDKLSNDISIVDRGFDSKSFQKAIIDESWADRELKNRANHIAEKFDQFLPYSFEKQVEILSKVAQNFNGFVGTIFPTFIEKYGLDDPEISIPTLADFTTYSTSEFAIRPFLVKYPETLKTLYKWSTHENYHVRRLASEGCRPLLPWATKLHQFVVDPAPIIPILKNLRNDPEDYVYRSVANNLNDISKNQPELVLDLCKDWVNESKTTHWVSKHALRTLLKKGNQEAMQLFGFGSINSIVITEFNLNHSSIAIGDETVFNITLQNTGRTAKFRLEYAISYLRQNGQHKEKVFQLRELEIKQNEVVRFSKKLSFKELSTRKHYAGEHYITLKINGKSTETIHFKLE